MESTDKIERVLGLYSKLMNGSIVNKAAEAIASLVDESQLNEDFVLPEPFDPRVAQVVANAVKANIVK